MQSVPTIDLYRELEVDPGAATETIDAAWKSLLKRHHPDVASDSAADERVKRLNLAHEWLSDPRLRQLYDRARRRPTVISVPPAYRPPGATAERATAGAGAGGAGSDQTYREFSGTGGGTAGHARQGSEPRPTLSAQLEAALRRLPSYVIPVALVGVLIVVAAASYLGSQRPGPGGSAAVAQLETGSPTATPRPSGTGEVSGVSGAGGSGSLGIDPRALPPPNVNADVPASCQTADPDRVFSYTGSLGEALAQIVIVRCDALRSFGPLVYLAGTGGWQLIGKGAIENGFASQAFSGPLSAKGRSEFGVAWTSGDGTASHVVVYRLSNGLETIWNSADAGLDWYLAAYDYQSASAASPAGYLVITSADRTTGTCATCHDHTLFREFYAWSIASGGGSGLVRTSRQPAGVGP